MELRTYQTRALGTMNPAIRVDRAKSLGNALTGLLGELGEVADLFKKHWYHGHGLDRDKVLAEIGDLHWYVALLCEVVGLDIATLERDPEIPELAPGDPDEGIVLNCLTLAGQSLGRIMDILDNDLQGDRLWDNLVVLLESLRVVVHRLGSSVDAVLENNLAKLARRYPDGFTRDRSLDRAV